MIFMPSKKGYRKKRKVKKFKLLEGHWETSPYHKRGTKSYSHFAREIDVFPSKREAEVRQRQLARGKNIVFVK